MRNEKKCNRVTCVRVLGKRSREREKGDSKRKSARGRRQTEGERLSDREIEGEGHLEIQCVGVGDRMRVCVSEGEREEQ